MFNHFMKATSLRLNGELLISMGQEFQLKKNPSQKSKTKIFTYTLDENPKIILNNCLKVNEYDNILIRINVLTHHIYADKASKLNTLSIHLNSKLLNYIYDDVYPLFLTDSDKNNNEQNTIAIKKLIENFYYGIKELMHDSTYVTDDILKFKIKELFFLLSKLQNFNIIRQALKELHDDSHEFKSIVENNLFKANSIQELASSSNMSLSKFKRKFNEIYHTTPNRYIMNKRIEKVAFLLKHSNNSISQIGYDCGFIAPAHLTRVFKAKYKKTPSEYRQEHLN